MPAGLGNDRVVLITEIFANVLGVPRQGVIDPVCLTLLLKAIT